MNQIHFEPVFPLWLIVSLLILGWTAVIIHYFIIRRRLSRSRSLSLSLLRLAAVTLIVCFALNPSRVTIQEHTVLPALAVMIDSSPSMGLPGISAKGSRLDEARALLLEGANPLLKSLSENFEVRLYTLGESLKSLQEGDLAQLKPGEKRGDLKGALEELKERSSLALLLSDGNFKGEGGYPAGFPLMVFPLGDPDGYRDILIKSVRAPSLAFQGREAPIDITIKGYGYAGLTLPVLLKDGGRLITAKSIRLNGNTSEATLSQSFTPEEVGQYNLSLSIPQQVGESLGQNNQFNFSLKVVRDKIRILMISGSPSPSYRFMRAAFKNDPSIDLLSFVILRTPSDIMNVPLQEQSLIPFPVDTLFAKELSHFDLLIFDDYDYRSYFSPKYLERVREFVRGGGGFAMIGGTHSFSAGGYAGTPLEEILPVRLSGKEDYLRGSPEEVKLSRKGVSHPITHLSPDEGNNLWREMPPLEGINLLASKNNGTVLLESASASPRPILTVGNYGKGRVLVLATDYSWKWSMGMVAKGVGNWPYLRLMERMVRWVTKDPALDPVEIILPEKGGTVGEQAEFRVKVRENELPPNLQTSIFLSVLNPEGNKIRSELKRAGEQGEYLGSFLPEGEGAFKVRVETPGGLLETSMVITGPLSGLDAAPDYNRLKMVADATGGKFLSRGNDLSKELGAFAEKGRNRFLEERLLPLWGRSSILILILFLLSGEWYFRRRWGLI